MNNIQNIRYIAVMYYRDTNNLYYVLYDYYIKDIKIVSASALKLMTKQVLNIDCSLTTLMHLTPIWMFAAKNSFAKEPINLEIKKVFVLGEQVTKIIISNTSHKKLIANAVRDIWMERITDINIDEAMYNSCRISLVEYYDKYVLNIANIIGNIDGNKNLNPNVDMNSKVFLRNTIKNRSDNNINNIIESTNNKLKLIGKDTLNIDYVMINNECWLINMDCNDKEIRIPKFIDKLGYDISFRIIFFIITKGTIVYMTEKQRQSLVFFSALGEEDIEDEQQIIQNVNIRDFYENIKIYGT